MRILYDIPMLIFGKLNITLPFLEKGFNNKIKILNILPFFPPINQAIIYLVIHVLDLLEYGSLKIKI